MPAARGPVRTRPASSRQTCWRHIQRFQGSSSPAPPSQQPQAPHGHTHQLHGSHGWAHAAAGTAAGLCPSSPGQPWGQDPWVQPASCSPCSQSSLCSGQSSGRTGLCRQGWAAWLGTAWHGMARRRAGLSCSWGSHPAWRVADLLVPPQPRPAVTGAHDGATSTPTNCITWSQGELPAACVSLPEPAWPKPLHPPRLPRTGRLRWPAAAGFSHLLLAVKPAQTHTGSPHLTTAPVPDNGAGPSSCWCRARVACGACPAAHPPHSCWGLWARPPTCFPWPSSKPCQSCTADGGCSGSQSSLRPGTAQQGVVQSPGTQLRVSGAGRGRLSQGGRSHRLSPVASSAHPVLTQDAAATAAQCAGT